MAVYLGNKKVSIKSVVPSSSAGFTFKDFFEHNGKLSNTNYVDLSYALQYSDTENVTDLSEMCSGCPNLTTVPLIDTSKATTMYRMFRNCPNLTAVPAFDTSKVTQMGEMFSGCTNLTAIHMTGMAADLDISASTQFTREALVEILNNLATVTSTKTLTMGTDNLNKLTYIDKSIATNKGWTLN